MDDGAGVAPRRVVDEPDAAGLHVHLDLGEPGDERHPPPALLEVVAGDAHQPLSGEGGGRGRRHPVDVLGQLVAVVAAADVDGPLRHPREAQAHRAVALAEHALAADGVVVGHAPEVAGRDLAHLLPRVEHRRPARAGVRVGGRAARLQRAPRQVPARVAPRDVALLPGHVHALGDGAHHVEGRPRAEVADARLDGDAPVGPDDEQPVDAGGAGREGAQRHADPGYLRAVAPAAALHPLAPVEELGPLVDGLPREGARHVPLLAVHARGAELRLALGRVDLQHVDLVEAELLRRLLDDGRQHRHRLLAAGGALGGARRGVGVDPGAAHAHGHRLIGERAHDPEVHVVAGPRIGAVVADGVDVEGGDPTVAPHAEPDAGLDAGSGLAERRLVAPGHPHHDRLADLLRQQHGNLRLHVAGRLAAEAAAGELVDEDHVRRLDAGPARHRPDAAVRALHRRVHVDLLAFPVGHGGAALERLVRERLVVRVLLDDDVGVREPRREIAVRPLVGGLRLHRKLARREPRQVRLGPLDLGELAPPHRVALGPGVRSPGTEAVEGVEDERQRLEVDVDELDGAGRGLLVDGGHREDGLALVARLVGQGRLVRHVDLGQVVRGQDALDARQGLGRAGVDGHHPRVGHRAHQQLAEDHALGPMVLGVAGTAGDLRVKVRQPVVLSEQFVVSHFSPPEVQPRPSGQRSSHSTTAGGQAILSLLAVVHGDGSPPERHRRRHGPGPGPRRNVVGAVRCRWLEPRADVLC